MATLARHCCKKLLFPFHNFRLRTSLSLVRYHGNDHHDDHHHHDDHEHSSRLYAQHLTTRGLVEISGTESMEFLQGLITSDMTRFSTNDDDEPLALYAGMLNPQGRLLYDLLLYSIDKNTYWAECDTEAVDDLIKILKRHRLRKKIGIENMTEGMKIWSLFRDITDPDVEEPDFIDQKFNLAFAPDPRIKSFGWRLILPEHTRMENTVRNAHELVTKDLYTPARYRIGVAEGVHELPPGKAFPLESNFDFLNGVSFTKGCYIGQELTARTHHTGVTRKRVMPVKFAGSPELVRIGDKVKNNKDKDVGTIRAVHDNYGLAVLRIGNLTGTTLRVQGTDSQSEAVVSLPRWWPLGDKELKKVGFSLTRDNV